MPEMRWMPALRSDSNNYSKIELLGKDWGGVLRREVSGMNAPIDIPTGRDACPIPTLCDLACISLCLGEMHPLGSKYQQDETQQNEHSSGLKPDHQLHYLVDRDRIRLERPEMI